MLIVARVLAGLLLFDEQTIIVSAHRQDTAREVFFRLVQFIEDNPDLEERVDFIARSEMREFIRMKSGQEVRFKARSSGSGRGFSCDCLMLDEAQILGAAAWSAILPTMSARPNPQVWLLGTPPTPLDDGEVFGRIREAGIAGRESRIAYMEWSAEVGDDMDDPAVWAKANPAFGSRISHEAIASERATMNDEQFAMERLGIWDTRAATAVFGPGAWEACAGERAEGVPLGGMAVAADKALTQFTVVGAAVDGELVHVRPMFSGPNSADAVDWLTEWHEEHGVPVAVDGRGPAAVLIPSLEQNGVPVTVLKTPEVLDAHAGIFVAVSERKLRHSNYPELDAAVEGATTRDVGDRWAWGRKGDQSVAPLEGATFAHWLVTRPDPEPERSAYADHDLIII